MKYRVIVDDFPRRFFGISSSSDPDPILNSSENSQIAVPNSTPSGSSHTNRPFPSSLVPLFQSESKC